MSEPALPLDSVAFARADSATRARSVSDLQQAHGNAFVQRQIVQRQPDAEQTARRAFIARGLMPNANGLDTRATTTQGGGFNARFDPSSGELLIRLRVGINFLDGINITDAATGAIAPATADFAGAARTIRTLHPDAPSRVADVTANWQWNAGAKTQWARDYATAAQTAWGGKHYFHSRRWPDLSASVRVEMDVHDGHRATDHCKATVYKSTSGFSDMGASVDYSGASGTGYRARFASSALGAPLDFLNYRLEYPSGGVSVAQATGATSLGAGDPGPTYLNKFIADFQRGRVGEGAPVHLIGHASAGGNPAANQRISDRRAQNVAAYLRSSGQRIAGSRIDASGVGAEGATAADEWRRVDIQVGSGQAQVTMIHETGHMFGLGDEYASPAGGFAPGAGTPGTIGQPAQHGALASAMGGGVQGAVYENNDNIMSVGNVVRPQHYATFLEALNAVATPEAFEYGGPGRRPLSPVDLVRPPGPPGTAVA
ncbi:MAG: OmpA family protein [Chloroflexi bacterium]|nr:OmpA family protein [Chloroflexota bacterium]